MTRTERVARAIELLAQLEEIGGNKAGAFTLRKVGAVGTVFDKKLAAALTAIDEERDALREALAEALADVQYVLDELLPKHSPILVATKLTLLRDKLDQARSLSSVSREGNCITVNREPDER